MQIISLIGAIVAVVFMIWSIYKGLNLPLACIITTVIIAVTSGIGIDEAWDSGMDIAVLAMFESTVGVYIFGGLLGLMYSESGAAVALSNVFFKPFRGVKNQTVRMMCYFAAFLVLRLILGLTGIDPMAIIITMVAVLIPMFQELNIPRKFACCLLACSTTVGACLPYVPSITNIFLPNLIPGFTASSLAGMRILWTVLFLVLSVLWMTWMIRRDQKKGGSFALGNMKDEGLAVDENQKRPNALISLLPIIVILLLYNFAGFSGWLSTACGVIVGIIIFYRYMPLGDGTAVERFKVFISKVNKNSLIIPLYMGLSVLPGAVLTIAPCYELLTSFASSLANMIPPAVAFALIGVVMVLMGNSATVICANMATSIFIPAGLAASAAGFITIMSLTVFDSLPNSPGINMQAQFSDTTMQEGYPPVFKTTVLLTFVLEMAFALLISIGLAF